LISVFFFPLGFSYCNNQLLIFFLGVLFISFLYDYCSFSSILA
jgi:hypothetical protein